MKLEINSAELLSGYLYLKIPVWQSSAFVKSFKPGNYEIVAAKKKRSLNANNLAWELIDKIAMAIREDPVQVYRDAVLHIPGVTDWVLIKEEAAEAFSKAFIGTHIGRQTRTQPATKTPGYVYLFYTYGSSDYDTQQMSMLIDNLVQDCKNLGIETEEPEYIDSLLKEWGA